MTAADITEERAAPRGAARSRRGRGRRKKIVFALLGVVAAGATAATTLGLGGGGPSGEEAAGGLPPTTVPVTRQMLQDTRSEDGALGYGPATAVTGRRPGTVTGLPQAEAKITRGRALFLVDDRPVILMYGSLPAYRTLRTGTKGADVRQLERNLRALGYSGFTVDEEFSGATAYAVRRWQRDRGLPRTGSVELGRVVFTGGPVRVDSVEAQKGGAIGPGQKVLSYTGTAKIVTVELDTAERRLAREGARVGVGLPDGDTVRGVIATTSTYIQPASGERKAQTKVKVLVRLYGPGARAKAAGYDQADVRVDFIAGERPNVLTVPVAALLALSEGGFGVEVVEGSTSKYVPVTTGLFAGGRVEITGVAEGANVGMPK